jgi:hypothetical protein
MGRGYRQLILSPHKPKIIDDGRTLFAATRREGHEVSL